MLYFICWSTLIISCIFAWVFGDPDARGVILMLAVFVAIGTTTYLTDKVKKNGQKD